MKNLILIFTFMLFVISAYGQNTFPSTGNVGIGTTSPGARLDVRYSTGAGTISQHAIRARRYTSTTTDVTSYDKAIWGELVDYDIPANMKDSGYKIGVEGSSFANNISNFAGTLKAAYGVWARTGIYRSASNAIIENAYAVNAEVLSSQSNASIINAYGVYINNGTGATSITNNYGVYQLTPVAKNFFAGDVGIGTDQPGSKLGVVSENQSGTPSHGSLVYFRQASNPDGNDLKPTLEISNAGGNGFGLVSIAKSNYFSGKIGIGTSEPSKPLSVVVDGHSETPSHSSVVYFKQASNPAGDDLKPALEINNVGGTGYGLVSIATNNYISGKVGIGTTTPTEKLTVNGKINAEEIILEDVDGADFVFEEDYDLRSLEETEQFIKANKHLPEIPSAAEMAEEGLEIKELNILLLQKVEELTLHLIEQNKQIQSQQAEIEALKAKID